MFTSIPQLIEAAWQQAQPGREAAERNEALRAVRELLEPRRPPPMLRVVSTRA